MSKKKKKSYYYDVRADLKNYPQALIYVTFGGRSTGKTYSSLRYCIEDKVNFIFVKRTIEDVKLLTAGNKLGSKKEEGQANFDASPFKPLNRDFGWNIRAFSVFPGLGGFYRCDSNNNPVGDPVGYVVALNAVGKIKGFSLEEADVIIFDEFVTKIYEKGSGFNKHEDKQLFDLYKTVSRDREHRGRAPIKIIALANADDIASPLISALEQEDALMDMAIKNQEYHYDPDRMVLLHKLKTSEEFAEKESQSPIYKATAGSEWASSSLGNDFAYNDLSNVGRVNMKNMICEARVYYKNRFHFVYYDSKAAARYVTYSNYNKMPLLEFDLTKIAHKRKFLQYAEFKVTQLFYGNEEPWFEKYSLKNLYYNARKILF